MIEPPSCKLFGPTLSGVVSSTAMYVANPQRRTAVLSGLGRRAAYKAALFWS